MKIGRNDPCPCGSGKKHKKCCGFNKGKMRIPDELFKMIDKDNKRKHNFGNVKPIISADYQDGKVIAVGNEVHFSRKWKTFHDFLFHYIKTCLGEDWGNQELKKSLCDRHPILQWYQEVCSFQNSHIIPDEKIHHATCTGVVGSYLALAYDLYVLRHHSKLQRKLVERLKHVDQFQGARYEMYVSSAFIKAGYEIEFEDEDDRSRSHCEFVAFHKDTKKSYSVEAKSRHRIGFLGQKGSKQNYNAMKLRIGKLLNDALKKDAKYERIVFIDVNLPPEEEKEFKVSWFKPLIKIIGESEKHRKESAFLFFTNHPAHYIGSEETDPPKNYFLTAINIDEFKVPDSKIAGNKYPLIFDLWNSINKYNSVPHEFEK